MTDLDSLMSGVFFNYMKDKHSGICECGCNTPLPKVLDRTNMDHILEKSKYPLCKYSRSNIAFYTSEHHANKTLGNLTPIQQLKQEEALKNYEDLCEESRIFESTLKELIWQRANNL